MAKKDIQELAEVFIKTSSEKDFIKLYKRIRPGLFNYCRTILYENELIEDAVSNTILKILTKISQYNPNKGNFSTWIYNIARNESLIIKKENDRYLSRNEMKGESIFEELEEKIHYTPFEKEEVDINSLYESVLEKIKELPDIYKDILYDREVLKMKYEEIAQKHKMKKRAVATRIRRGRLKIRKMFPNVKIIYND